MNEPQQLADDSYVQAEDDRANETRGRKFNFGLLALFAVGIVIFVTTSSTVAGAVLPSLFVAWGSLRAAWWIVREDYHPSRRVICFAFYLATACWHAAAVAFASLLTFVCLTILTGSEPTMETFVATMFTIVGGAALATILGLGASISAALAGVRVWVNPKLRKLTHDDLRNVATLPNYPAFNHAVFVLATSVALPILATCCYLLTINVSGTVTLVALTLGPLTAIVGYYLVSSRMIAKHPAECRTE